MSVYLAGPDVFLPAPNERGAALQRLCAAHGLEGVFPLDPLRGGDWPAWDGLPEAFRIARRNEAHITSCDALIANLTPFRGPSADVGTVFELGFMRALGRPVFGWSNNAIPFAERTRSFIGGTVDADGLAVEDFGLADNLMIEGGIHGSGGSFFAATVPADAVWRDLTAFERCLAAAARLMR